MNEKLDAAIYKAGQTAPFLRIALASCTMIISDEALSNGHPTTACDQWWRVYVHPEVLITHSTLELTHLLLHEVSHLVRRHHKRLKNYEQQKANVAGDCEIESHSWPGLIRLKGGATPRAFGLQNGLTAEAYIALLPDFTKPPDDCGSGSGGNARPWELPKSAAPAVGESKAEAIAQATAEAIQRNGRGSGHGWSRWSVEQLAPTVNWKQFIRSWVQSSRVKHGSQRLSYRNPRIKHGVVRRGWVGNKIHLGVVCDTSGSMAGSPIAAALAEVIGIASTATVDAYWQDVGESATVQRKVKRWSDLEPVGGGGTDLRPAIKQAAEDEPDGIIVITDCDTPWEDFPPAIPTLVVRVAKSLWSTATPPATWETVTVS